jgi:predicted transcriptional regulator of viral defense system
MKRMARPAQDSPWQALFRLAVTQEGLFSARQAASAGCSQQLLAKYVASGRVERVQRALYRIPDFPAGEHEGLVAIWLWSRNEGVFSHETALFLHDLSDALPVRAHITLPSSWAARAIHPPENTAVYHADIIDGDRAWIGPIPVTSVRRTLADCLHSAVPAELVAQASAHAAERGLISAEEVLPAPAIGLWRMRLHS